MADAMPGDAGGFESGTWESFFFCEETMVILKEEHYR
jgi:hypothetical protein